MISSCRPWVVALTLTIFHQYPRWLYDTLLISEEASKLLLEASTLDPRFCVTMPELEKRVAEMLTSSRDMEDEGRGPATSVNMVVDEVLVRDMSELGEVAIVFDWDLARRKLKWRTGVGAKLGDSFARLR